MPNFKSPLISCGTGLFVGATTGLFIGNKKAKKALKVFYGPKGTLDIDNYIKTRRNKLETAVLDNVRPSKIQNPFKKISLKAAEDYEKAVHDAFVDLRNKKIALMVALGLLGGIAGYLINKAYSAGNKN